MPEPPPLPTAPAQTTALPYTAPRMPVYNPTSPELIFTGEPVQLELPFVEP
jgi:hypothetical protein